MLLARACDDLAKYGSLGCLAGDLIVFNPLDEHALTILEHSVTAIGPSPWSLIHEAFRGGVKSMIHGPRALIGFGSPGY